MTIRARTHTLRANHRAWLYSLIYASRISVFTVLFLFVSFLVQPFHQAMANESEAADLPEAEVAVTADPVTEQIPVPLDEELLSDVDEVSSESLVDAAVIVDHVSTSNSVASPVTTTESEEMSDIPLEAPSEETTTEGVISEETLGESIVDDGSQDASSTDDDTVDDSIDESVEGEPSDDTQADESVDNSTASDADQIEDDETTALVNTTEVIEDPRTAAAASSTIVKAENLVTDDNFYQFSRQSCVAIGDGTYHCSLNTSPGVDMNTVVYADHDAEGDMEIYLRTAKGVTEQITDNSFDDTSPYLDVESLRLVWQRLIDDRYQIILYDIEDKHESQLTFSRTNNMEPKVSKQGVVWQAWDNNDWEIMYFDGKYTDQLTDNGAQDVTPVIEDGYVLWSVLGLDTQEAMVYSLATNQTMTITDHEGGSIVNPRFILVYDTKFDNGDIITQGFDPLTGLSAPIAAKPAPKPMDIPSADPTGEIRALIQNKSSQKEIEITNDVQPGSGATGDPDSASSTAASSSTLNLKQVQSDSTLQISTTTPTVGVSDEPDFELTDFDLVITSTTTNPATGTTTTDIPVR